jgi:hypothetical protein
MQELSETLLESCAKSTLGLEKTYKKYPRTGKDNGDSSVVEGAWRQAAPSRLCGRKVVHEIGMPCRVLDCSRACTCHYLYDLCSRRPSQRLDCSPRCRPTWSRMLGLGLHPEGFADARGPSGQAKAIWGANSTRRAVLDPALGEAPRSRAGLCDCYRPQLRDRHGWSRERAFGRRSRRSVSSGARPRVVTIACPSLSLSSGACRPMKLASFPPWPPAFPVFQWLHSQYRQNADGAGEKLPAQGKCAPRKWRVPLARGQAIGAPPPEPQPRCYVADVKWTSPAPSLAEHA